MTDTPNLLFITIDSLRRDWLGCYGAPEGLTPNIDRLAGSSVVFDQAITGGSWTQAAFPVMLTSTYASMYGGCLGPLSEDRPSPIEALAESGYLTVGLSTSPLLSRKLAYDRGFHEFFDLVPGETDPVIRKVKGGERLLRLPITHAISNSVGIQTRPARKYVSAAEITELVCRQVDSISGPFFLWAHYMDPHWPYHIEETLRRPADIAQAWQDVADLYRANRKGETTSAAQRARYIKLYERAVRYTDAMVGRLLDHLEDAGLMDNTVIVIVSDHGEEFMERKHWGHFEVNLFDEILRVPLLIRVPRQGTAQLISKQVRTLDLMPTFLDLASCPSPEGMHGLSLAPLWRGNQEAYTAASSISEMWRLERHIVALRTEAYKYIWDSKPEVEPLLFDLKADPKEKHNIAPSTGPGLDQYQAIVDQHLDIVSQTDASNAVQSFETDEDLVGRLRDLGYMD